MGFYDILETTGLYLHSGTVLVGEGICDFELNTGIPPLILEFNDAPYVLDLGLPFVLDMSSSPFELEFNDAPFVLICPY